jgi:amidohydrolase
MSLSPDSLDGMLPALRRLRHDLHAHPELAYQEYRTAGIVASTLRQLGLQVHTGIGGTGVVASLRVGQSTRSIGLRADMDALPIIEQGQHAHASTVAGVHHGCGHDGHTTMLIVVTPQC